MTCMLRLSVGEDSRLLWDAEILLTSDEVEEARRLCKSNFWKFSAQLIPVRTHHWRGFARDFFIPAAQRVALRVDSHSKEIFAMAALALLLDLTTFPCRVLTCIPRAVYNALHPKERDPFYLCLRSKGVEEKILNADCLFVKFDDEEKEHEVSFFPLPDVPGCSLIHEGENCWNEWTSRSGTHGTDP